ncbi:hypothetical protein AB0399_04125 [Streptomyces sp. NPDC088194]|uniref:HEAT repeat domain-containing protein n=1 Tax=Streptomyces sp. NPDC088194 TaxID=3154931 RepID=UPI00344B7A8D
MATDPIRGLASDDTREAAANALVALGAEAVEPLVRELADGDSPVGPRQIREVLQRIGSGALEGLWQGFRSAPAEASRSRLGYAFSSFGPVALDHYRTALASNEPFIRAAAVEGVRGCDEAGRTALPSALPLLADPDPEIARKAQFLLVHHGQEVVPLLQDVRRRGPGRLRARALTVLADIGGEAALSAADVAAVERLIRIRLRDDRPTGIWACWNHWIAVPSGDQAGVMAALGLTDPRPATFKLAHEVIDSDGHCHDDSAYSRVFVTPELDGWTLVLGAWCSPCHEERSADVLRLCTELSARYGQAQAYYWGGQGDGSAWLVAERGAVVRRYCESGEADDELLTLGEPLAFEREHRTKVGLRPEWDPAQESEEDEDTWTHEAYEMAPDIARALGVSPLALEPAIGPDTPSRGTGVIALTPYAAAHGVPPGAYGI